MPYFGFGKLSRQEAKASEGVKPMFTPTKSGEREAFEAALHDYPRSYKLGSPESRAILTAIEHARAVLGLVLESNQ